MGSAPEAARGLPTSASRHPYSVREREVGSLSRPLRAAFWAQDEDHRPTGSRVPSFCSIGAILPSRPARSPCRRAQRRSRMARLRATASAARSILDGREHDGRLDRVGAAISLCNKQTIKRRPRKTIKKRTHAQHASRTAEPIAPAIALQAGAGSPPPRHRRGKSSSRSPAGEAGASPIPRLASASSPPAIRRIVGSLSLPTPSLFLLLSEGGNSRCRAAQGGGTL